MSSIYQDSKRVRRAERILGQLPKQAAFLVVATLILNMPFVSVTTLPLKLCMCLSVLAIGLAGVYLSVTMSILAIRLGVKSTVGRRVLGQSIAIAMIFSVFVLGGLYGLLVTRGGT